MRIKANGRYMEKNEDKNYKTPIKSMILSC